jgi:hypothetical protein
MKKIITKEEKVAKQLSNLVSDVTLDLDEVGKALAYEPTVLSNRLDIVVESAREAKEETWQRN